MPTHIVTKEESGKRLDILLTDFIESSRSQIQKLIKDGEITVNNKSKKSHVIIEKGDVIFYPEVEKSLPKKKGGTPILNILYEDDDLLVINKPPGLIVHQATEYDKDTNVVDALLEQYPKLIEVGDDPTRPGIVHRLDKDVSGVMVISKTQEAFENLKTQFATRTVEKEYLALVYGVINKDYDTINLKIARSKTRGRMVARPDSQEGKEAVTEYEVVERYKTATYLRVKIHTGRTHQIRVHFQAIDHPLVGDKLYKKRVMKNIRPIKLDRIFLHAHKLTITLLNGKRKNFEVPLPDELTSLLQKLPTK